VILADYVTLEAGTGCVHIAPGHGYEDYIYGLKYNLPILNPVDSKGRFTEEFAPLKGKYVLEANKDIVEMMRANESLLYTETISHSYPHCWRCKSPIIFRATSQWFISMEKDNFRGQALEAIKKVKWLNEWGENRITKMVESRPDWCISRQRVWGVPIFVFNCTACEKNIVTEDTIAKVHEIIRRDGSDGWYKYSEKEILGEDFKCPHCKAGIENIKKENDIFDVWFDSGSSSFSVLENNETVAWPADLYLEGSDQYRGWFQSSLLTAIGFKGKSPYKAVISTGWVVDGQGRAMHKSLGNIIDPLDLIKQSGADVLRLWVASEDFTADQPISNEIMARVTDSYRRIRNTFRFMLGCMEDFSKEDAVPYEKLNKLDKYAIDRLETLAGNIDKYYESFEFFKVYKDYMQFCSTFLSSFYFDIIKDRIYTYKNDSLGRRGAQTVVYKMLMKMVKLIAPVLVFTADEAWQFIPAKLRDEEFVQWTLWNEASEKRLGENELKEWDMINEIREIVMKKAEEKRAEKIIKHPYECDVTVKYSSKTLAGVLEKFKEDLAEIFIVSHVILVPKDIKEADWTADLEISVDKASGEKCGRCWRYETSVGKNVDYVELCERCIENL